MAPPLYFFAKITADQLVDPAGRFRQSVLDSCDLLASLGDVGKVREQCAVAEVIRGGPDGGSGCVVTVLPASGKAPLRVTYQPDFQDWTQISAQLWIGLDKEYPVEPDDVARPRFRGGYPIRIPEHEWIVPILRNPDGKTGLPRRFSYRGRDLVEAVDSDYLALWQRSEAFCGAFYDPMGPLLFELPVPEVIAFCIDALAVNYRYGRPEQTVLGLVNSDNFELVAGLAVDVLQYYDLMQQVLAQKKTKRLTQQENPSSASSATPADSAAQTSPASPNT